MSFINNTNISSLLSLLPGFGEPELTLSNNNRTISNIFTMAVYKINLNSLMRKIFLMLSIQIKIKDKHSWVKLT